MLISFWLEPILNPIGERAAVNVSGNFLMKYIIP